MKQRLKGQVEKINKTKNWLFSKDKQNLQNFS